MLQFLLGLSTANVNWLLAGFLGGIRVYNSPPLFFFAIIPLLTKRFLSGPIIRILAVIAIMGTVSGVLFGFDKWHARQTVAFIVAATVWIYVYQTARRRDIFTMERTLHILAVYFVYLLVILTENLLGTNGIGYAVSCIFSAECGASAVYSRAGRVPYFSVEASSAALAIVATIMPYVCANAVINRNMRSYGLLAVACVVLFFAEGITSRTFILFSIGFVILPRLAVLGVPALMVLIVAVSASVSYVLEDKGALVALVQTWFGGLSSRIDVGIETGSYTSRFMAWVIGARAFLASPFIGVGFGGTQTFFYQLYDAGFDVVLGDEQASIVDENVSAYNSPMVVRIPAEIGMLGVLYLTYYGWRLMRLALRARAENTLVGTAFLYSVGALLLSFCFAGELLNPCIPACLALLGQVLRSKETARLQEHQPAPPASEIHPPETLAPGLT